MVMIVYLLVRIKQPLLDFSYRKYGTEALLICCRNHKKPPHHQGLPAYGIASRMLLLSFFFTDEWLYPYTSSQGLKKSLCPGMEGGVPSRSVTIFKKQEKNG